MDSVNYPLTLLGAWLLYAIGIMTKQMRIYAGSTANGS